MLEPAPGVSPRVYPVSAVSGTACNSRRALRDYPRPGAIQIRVCWAIPVLFKRPWSLLNKTGPCLFWPSIFPINIHKTSLNTNSKNCCVCGMVDFLKNHSFHMYLQGFWSIFFEHLNFHDYLQCVWSICSKNHNFHNCLQRFWSIVSNNRIFHNYLHRFWPFCFENHNFHNCLRCFLLIFFENNNFHSYYIVLGRFSSKITIFTFMYNIFGRLSQKAQFSQLFIRVSVNFL